MTFYSCSLYSDSGKILQLGSMSEKTDLKRAGLRTTQPRLKILEILEESSARHLAADDIYRILVDSHEQIGLATVYRVLGQFESAGLVIRHNFEGGHSVFELSSEDHHDHIVCVRCNRVEEFSDNQIENRQKEVAKQLGFELTDHNLNMYGLCPDCLAG